MNHLLKFSTLILLFMGVTAVGQEPLRVSLSEAQKYAIEHNRTLKNAKLDLEISDLKVKETIAKGLPQVDASVDYTTYFGYEMGFSFGAGGGSEYTTEQLTSAWNQTSAMFPDFTQQDLSNYLAGSTYSGMLSAMTPTTIKMTDQSTGKIQIGQLIYSGQFWVGLQTAKLGKKIAGQSIESSILDVNETVANSYFMALVTQQSLEILNQNIDNLKKINAHTQRMYDTGVVEQTDVDQISMQVVMLENSKRSVERSLKIIYNLLKFQLGLEPASQLELTETLDQLLPKVVSGDISAQNFDIENNILFQMTETSEQISEQMVKMQKMAYVPTLSGYYAYNQKFLTTGFDMTPNHIAGVSLSIPIFSSGARKHALAQSKIELEKAKINKLMVSDQLKMQAEQLKFDLKSALENYESQKKNVAVARRSFESINKKYEQGMVSSLDLTQSNSNYLQAETNYVQASLSLMQAQIKLEKLYSQL